MKIVTNIKPKIVFFTAVKKRCMLHGRVFIMEPSPLPEWIAKNLIFLDVDSEDSDQTRRIFRLI